MNIIHITDFNNFIELAQSLYENGPASLIIGISSDINLWTNKGVITKINNQNIKIGVIEYTGGAIVNFPGDLNLLLTTYGNSTFGLDSLLTINTYLLSRGISSHMAGNDLMIEEYKVASYTKRAHLNGWYLNIIHFSIHTDKELVQSICTKLSNKIPGRLDKYSIDANILLTLLEPVINAL